ncbi:hypothetical protein [Vibrio parahaemolyticus]|uniref:hypothetical protein n=1 Tax=Vibrio parahaemolyticus TaxID=670 RepID=UPI0004D9CD14|nr:hypothetical protein [Vibrio parahaemolyticus]OQU12555.1 hypothetical protein EN01_021980 [Vibrio parahaemolyticus]
MNQHVLGVFIVGLLCFCMGKDHSEKAFNWSDLSDGEIIILVWAVVGCVFYLLDYSQVIREVL